MRAGQWAWACVVALGCGGNTETVSPTSGGGGAGGSTSNVAAQNAASNTSSTNQSTTSGGGGGPAGVVRFAALGDQGKGIMHQGVVDVAAALAAKCEASGCDFVQTLGDNLYDSGPSSANDGIFNTHFEQPYADVNAPFYIALGNHDYGGSGLGLEFNKGQYSVDYTDISDKWELPATYYHHALEHVEFFTLDTNMAMFSMAGDQESNFPTWIAASTATWKIGFGHHPYRSNGPHGNAGNYEGIPSPLPGSGSAVKSLLEETMCGQVDVYIAGHDHSIQWLAEPCSGTELIVSGAGASTTDLEGDNEVHFETLALGFLYVVIDGNTFTGEFIDTAGQVLFTRTITK